MPTITVEVFITAPIEKIWQYWTNPEHIINWNNASDDWHTPTATNDVRIGGKFNNRMESKDGSMGFNFEGVYTTVITNKLIEYVITDGRNIKIEFIDKGATIQIVETFDAEQDNSIEVQQAGWQAILNNFKKYTETNY